VAAAVRHVGELVVREPGLPALDAQEALDLPPGDPGEPLARVPPLRAIAQAAAEGRDGDVLREVLPVGVGEAVPAERLPGEGQDRVEERALGAQRFDPGTRRRGGHQGLRFLGSRGGRTRRARSAKVSPSCSTEASSAETRARTTAAREQLRPGFARRSGGARRSSRSRASRRAARRPGNGARAPPPPSRRSAS
jgi:hypothetical protein